MFMNTVHARSFSSPPMRTRVRRELFFAADGDS